ncbi:hypothetical protein CRE_19183 [Caenorhabditis remanei]|uniref:Uncharacterized protein n=2 Tax=Caenorhabditis remanei TaxID=31234 RepID=E3MJS5_CAERE|nr:hypothetical protein CRE_19183 [Caenorhabditis remanei]
MMNQLIVLLSIIFLSSAAWLPHPHRVHHPIRHDYNFERNCFFSPAQCLLGNFPRSSKLQPMLRVFEDRSLNEIYSKLLITNSKPAFFGSRK